MPLLRAANLVVCTETQLTSGFVKPGFFQSINLISLLQKHISYFHVLQTQHILPLLLYPIWYYMFEPANQQNIGKLILFDQDSRQLNTDLTRKWRRAAHVFLTIGKMFQRFAAQRSGFNKLAVQAAYLYQPVHG